MSDTVAVEEERLIAPPSCTIMPPPECEPRRAEAPEGGQRNAEVVRRANRPPNGPIHSAVHAERQSVEPVWCSDAVSAVRVDAL